MDKNGSARGSKRKRKKEAKGNEPGKAVIGKIDELRRFG
jgi:hypothetical protein